MEWVYALYGWGAIVVVYLFFDLVSTHRDCAEMKRREERDMQRSLEESKALTERAKKATDDILKCQLKALLRKREREWTRSQRLKLVRPRRHERRRRALAKMIAQELHELGVEE